MIREAKLEKILAPLSGKKKETMAFVLASVETSRLEEAYNHFIGRVLKDESSDAQPGADVKPVLESAAASVVATGDGVSNAPATQAATGDKFSQLRKLAGMTK
jgi:hypothetical protein